MVRIPLIHRPDEPVPVVHPRPIATTRPPLPLGAPARSVGVMRDLRAETRTLGMAIPNATQRSAARAAADEALKFPFGPDRYSGLRYVGIFSMRLVANEYDAIADELEAALAELAALAPLTAKAKVA